jgi:hypothetical protein
MSDAVDHPDHYNANPSGVECIDIVEHMPFNVGNAVKYLWRAGHKGKLIEDLRKAGWYIAREIGRLEKDLAESRGNGVLPPSVEEPAEFGSVVHVVSPTSRPTHWVRTYSVAVDKPWCTGNTLRSWADVTEDATAAEVIRRGIGGGVDPAAEAAAQRRCPWTDSAAPGMQCELSEWPLHPGSHKMAIVLIGSGA